MFSLKTRPKRQIEKCLSLRHRHLIAPISNVGRNADRVKSVWNFVVNDAIALAGRVVGNSLPAHTVPAAQVPGEPGLPGWPQGLLQAVPAAALAAAPAARHQAPARRRGEQTAPGPGNSARQEDARRSFGGRRLQVSFPHPCRTVWKPLQCAKYLVRPSGIRLEGPTLTDTNGTRRSVQAKRNAWNVGVRWVLLPWQSWPSTAQRCHSETENKNILEDLFSSVLSQLKKISPPWKPEL